MAIILSVATILGGIAAIWFFWDKITTWWKKFRRHGQPKQINLASNPTRDNIEKVVLASHPVDDWNHQSDSVRSVSSYKHDMNLRFEIKNMDDGIQCADFKEPWANRHPDPSATGYWCNLFYGSTLVERFILVAVDGGRAMLPIPKKARQILDPSKSYHSITKWPKYMTRSKR
jgi:hypothetical protein